MRAWSPAAEDKLRRLYPTTPIRELCFQLKRTPKAINSRAKVLGLRKDGRKIWTKAEDRILRKRFPHEPTKALALHFGCKPETVSNRAQRLGLHKTEAHLRSEAHFAPMREAINHTPAMVAARFKKGQVSHNKGLRRPGWAPGRMAETQFKKGERLGAAARNWVPIGTEKIDGYGTLVRKLNDTHPVPARRWEAVHRIVWMAAHGPVPAGHKIAFKPGCKTTVCEEITLDKLELVSDAEMMRRNTYHRYPKEISLAIHAKGVLRRAINKTNRGTTP